MSPLSRFSLRSIAQTMALVLGAAVLVMAISFVLSRQNVVEVLGDWERYQTENLHKINIYNQMRVEVGFGGIIHHFKNYLLRKEETYREEVYRRSENLRALIREYRLMARTTDEQAALDTILGMVNHLEGSMAVAESLFETGILLEEIDAQVRFDEKPAMKAMDLLAEHALAERDRGAEELVGRLQRNIAQTTTLGLAVVITFTLTLLLFLLGMRAYLLRMEATGVALTALAAGDTDLKIRYADERNEIGDLARSAVSFQTALIRLHESSEEIEATNTQLASTVDQLEATMDKAIQAEKMASLGQLVAGVAHEINTPLGVAVTASTIVQSHCQELEKQFLANNLSKAKMARSLQALGEAGTMVVQNLDRAARLVRSFRQIAADQHSDTPRVISLSEYLSQIMDSLRSQVSGQNIRLSGTCENDDRFKCYPGVLSQVITQLVLNSLAHAFPDGRAGDIVLELSMCPEDSGLEIECRDNGCGIPPESRELVFDPFYTTSRGSGRAGLGLHLVFNQVTTVLGGTIVCEPVVNGGTLFRVHVPAMAEATKEATKEA